MKKQLFEKKNKCVVKAVVAVLLCATMLMAVGCKSPLQRAAEEKAARQEAKVLDYANCYSDELGYHYPGYAWGESFSVFQQAADYPVSEISGYSADNGIVYDAEDWRIKFGDFTNDSASIATDEDARLRMIIFGIEDDAISCDYFEAYKAVLTTAFGVEPTLEEREEETEAGTFQYATYYFRKTLSDGKETSIQWAKATKKGMTEPVLITFAFACVFPDEEASSEAAK